MDYFKTVIKGDNWNFYLVEDDDNVVADSEDAAVCEFDKKEVYFRRTEIDIINVRHEVWHIYIGYCYLQTASLDSAAFEEITAELYAHEGEHISSKSKEILSNLLKLKDKKKERRKHGSKRKKETNSETFSGVSEKAK